MVDDDLELCSQVTQYLGDEGFKVDAVYDGEQGVECARSGIYELVVLDVMLPRLSGFDVLRRISGEPHRAVLMLSARGEDIDKIVGLQIGADDYLPKPFNPHELVARIRAILRRTCQRSLKSGILAHDVIVIGDVEMDKDAWKVRRSGIIVELTAFELNLLELLMRAAGRVLTREKLARLILQCQFDPYDRSIDTHVSNLRKKLGRQPDGSERIKSVRGVGYVYARPRESDS